MGDGRRGTGDAFIDGSSTRTLLERDTLGLASEGTGFLRAAQHSRGAGGWPAPLRFWLKRSLDVVAGTILLLVLVPLGVLTAVAITIDSPGPVFYRQERMGARRSRKDGETSWERRPFRIYKFRSMFADSDETPHRDYIRAFLKGEAAESGSSGAKYKITRDPRVTRVGRFLRRTSLDELPQLVNVLRGDMSLVGPRPVPPYEVEGYEPWHYERLFALPGITGLWQIYGRGRVTFEEMMRMDIAYVRNQSLLLDLKLLLLTIPAVLRGSGAE